MKNLRTLPLAIVLAALSLASRAGADSLADRAPADAVAFGSWAGTDALGKAYDGSHLKGLLETFNLPQLITQQMDKEIQKQDDPQKQADMKMVHAWIDAFIKSPTAVYFGPMDFANADQPAFKTAFYSQVGKEKAAVFAQQMNTMIARDKKEGEPPVVASVVGDYLLVTVGAVPEMEKRLSGAAPADGLANLAAFQKTMAQVGAQTSPSAMLVYVDGEAGVKLLGDAVSAKAGPMVDMWPKISDAIGLGALRQCAFSGHFDGPNWTSQAFIGLTEKRTGYMAFLDSKKLSDDVLKLIPKDVTCAGVIRFDGARLYNDVRDASAQIDPQNGQRGFDMGVQQFFAFTGVDLLKDLLEPLDDAFVVYAAIDGKGESLKHAVVVNKLKDAPKAEAGFSTLESVVSTMLGQRDPNGVQFKTENLPAPNDKVTAHVMTFTPQIAPAWTVANGNLYFSMSEAGLTAAVAGVQKAPILENPQFVELWKKLGVKEMTAFTYLDLPKLSAEFYPLAAKALADEKAAHPDDKNPFVLPPLDKINANLAPTLSVYWSDKDGFHAHSTGPLPLVDMMRPENMVQMMIMLVARPAAGVENAPAIERNMP